MRKMSMLIAAVALTMVATPAPVQVQGQAMSFFVTSTGSGNGGNLKWQAYLSTSMPDVHARDRIGSGPWYNAKGVLIASNVADLHSDKANINNDTALDEQGRTINAQGAPNRHDILTGSTPEGRATTQTCANWTSSAADQSAMLGHHDRLTFGKPGSPWNAAHQSKGCSQENLVATGGAGLLYCFAAN
jgi:hypothetical protein